MCVLVCRVVTDVLKDCSGFSFRVKEFKKNSCLKETLDG
jgi:hypothetical protein